MKTFIVWCSDVSEADKIHTASVITAPDEEAARVIADREYRMRNGDKMPFDLFETQNYS